jgi:hypothetical protein
MTPLSWITSISEQDRQESSREEEQRIYLLQAEQETARFSRQRSIDRVGE